MLDRLPPEIFEQILGHLPTASSVVNVARTNRSLHSAVSAHNYGIFRNFVQTAFPSIDTPPLWRDMACSLTSRSRAWDRNSFIARECYPSEGEDLHRTPATYQKFGFIPVIDSYEQWTGTSSSRKQVLAFGAGGRLRLRVNHHGRTDWRTLRLPDDHLQQNDIVDVRLLRPHQHHNLHGETIVLRRANREIVKIESGAGNDNLAETARYIVDGAYIDCLDVSTSETPLMATCNTRSLHLFPVHSDTGAVRPTSTLSFDQPFEVKHRKRCVKFLGNHTLAVGVQFVEGRNRAPILVYNISPSGITSSPLVPSSTIDVEHPFRSRHCANVIAGLDNTSSLASTPDQVFLSGWTDGIARLHDLRTPSQVVAQYLDHVDDGQILSLAAIGHERFFAGSHQNACLKVFDLRMQGARAYSYLDAVRQPSTDVRAPAVDNKKISKPRRNINIFLALTVQRNHIWAPLPRQHNTNQPRYRGSIYSLAVPSPSSSTLFAGIENHVIELDFVNSDDMLRRRGGPCDPSAGLSTLTSTTARKDVLSLSCYERPRDSHVATDPVLLRKQVNWHEVVTGIDGEQYGPAEEGWDPRWRLTRSWKTQGRSRRGRNRSGT